METIKEIRAAIRELIESQKLSQVKYEQMSEDLKQRFKATDKKFKETSRFLSEIGKQVGDLNNKFGSFAEGLAFPSLVKILEDHFHATFVGLNARGRKNGEHIELDVLGYSNGTTNTAVIAEIKSHLRDYHIEQILKHLKQFPEFFPAHADKKLFGLLAAVNAPESVRNLALKKGIYVATISDDTFKLDLGQKFKPRDFSKN